MRTNIDLNDDLVAEAMQATGARTKREVVERALAELVARSKRPSISGLLGLGGIEPGYNYKATRGGGELFRVEESRSEYVAAPSTAKRTKTVARDRAQGTVATKLAAHKPAAKSSRK